MNYKTISLYIDTSNVDTTYINSIREAKSFWEQREDVVFKEVSTGQNADLRVQWVKEFGGEKLGYALDNGFIEVGLGDSQCLGKWKAYTYDSVLHIAKHELGHVLGYEHSNNPSDLMYSETITKYEYDIEETEIIDDGGSRFYPICTKTDSNTQYTFNVNSKEPLNIYIVPSKTEYDKFTNKQEFSHYTDCQDSEVELYEKTCIIPAGSGIILENPSIFGLGASTQFNLKIKEL